MLNKGKKIGDRGGPSPMGGGGLFISGTNLMVERGGGRALGLQGERTATALNCTRTQWSCWGWLPRGHEVHLSGTRPGRGSRGCCAAIDGHIHAVFTRRDWGGRSGAAS